MSTDNTDKAQQEAEEDYDVNAESVQRKQDGSRNQRRPFQRNRENKDFRGGDRRQPRQYQAQEELQGFAEEQELQESEEGANKSGTDSDSDLELPPKPSESMMEQYDPVNDIKSRWTLEEDMSKDEVRTRAREDISYYDQMHKDAKEQIDMHTEDYTSMEYAKLQNELFSLIKQKVDNGDKARAQIFVSKIKVLYETAGNLKIDENTLHKIEELFINRRVSSDHDFFTEQMKMNHQIESKVEPSVSDYKGEDYIPGRDTFKDEPVAFEDYEQFIYQAMTQVNNLDNFHKEELQEDVEDIIEDQEREEISIGHQSEDDWDTIIDINRYQMAEQVENTNEEFGERLEEIQALARNSSLTEFKEIQQSFAGIINSISMLSSTLDRRLDQQYNEIMKQKGINHDTQQENNQLLLDQEPNDNLKAEYGQSLQMDQEIKEDYNVDVQEELEQQFDQTQQIMLKNLDLRDQLLESVQHARLQLDQVVDNRNKLINKAQQKEKEYSTHVIPDGVYKFQSPAQESRKEQLKNVTELHKKRKFSLNSKDISEYNTELDFLIKLHELSQPKFKSLKVIQNVFDAMIRNKVKPNEVTHQRIFEYAVISKNQELANQKLRDITAQSKDLDNTVVSPTLLKKFYKQSLRTDNFTGLAHLINYVEKQQLDVSSWSLSTFQSALNFYLNQHFDLTKLLTFSRYYIYVNDCRLEKALQNEFSGQAIDQLTELQKKELNSIVFRESDSLIDMRSLFPVLVDKVGEKDAVDPFTKQDVLWSLIDFFTRRGMADLMQKGDTNYSSLNERDIAKYFNNHINSTKAFERITNVVLRFDSKGETFQNAIIQHIKEYQSNNNGSMPYSFEPSKVQGTYLKIKNAQQQLGTKLNEKTVEYFLEVFQSLKMWPQVKDLCDNFKILTNINPETSELRQHYLTNALLKSDSDKHYYQVISQQVYNGKEELNAGYITSMTKAHLQDGSISHALKFFQESVQKISSMKQNREDYLVSMFDSVFNEEASKNLSYDEFKDKYLKTILMSQQSIKEAQAYTTLKSVIENKNFDQIQKLMHLYLVQREEQQIIENIHQSWDEETQNKFPISCFNDEESFTQMIEKLDEQYLEDQKWVMLQNVKRRLEVLQESVSYDDYKRVLEIRDIMGDQKFELITGLEGKTAEEIEELFNIRSKEEIDAMLAEVNDFYSAAVHMTRKYDMAVLDSFHSEVEEKIEAMDKLINPPQLHYEYGRENTNQNNKQKQQAKKAVAVAASSPSDGGADGAAVVGLDENQDQEDDIEEEEDESLVTQQEKRYFLRKMRVTEEQLSQMTLEQIKECFLEAERKSGLNMNESSSESEEEDSDEDGDENDVDDESEDEDEDTLQAADNQGFSVDEELKEELELDDSSDEEDDQLISSDDDDEIIQTNKAEAQAVDNFGDYENQIMEDKEDEEGNPIPNPRLIEGLDLEDDSDSKIQIHIDLDLGSQNQNKIKLTEDLMTTLIEDENFQDEETQEFLAENFGKTLNMKEVASKHNYERVDPSVWGMLKNLYTGKFAPHQERIEDTMETALMNNFDAYEESDIEDPYDETVIEKNAHNQTVVELEGDLLDALNNRRKNVLEISINLFNKMQEKKLPMRKLQQLEKIEPQNMSIKEINKTVNLCEKLLRDSRSPLISALNTFVQYKEEDIEEDFDRVFQQNGSDMHDSEFDLEHELIAQKHLVSLTARIVETSEGLNNLNKKILEEQLRLNNSQQAKENQRQKKLKQQKITEELEQRIQELYDQYQQRVVNNKNVDYASDISRETKLELLADLFKAEYNNSFTSNLFPAYYSQDLIIFGLQNNIPEAVRLGEHMMSSNGQTLPREMQFAVREYKLQNADKYRKAIQNTGPIDNTSLYKSLNNSRKKNETPVMMIADDPYWINLQRTTYKRSEAWKRPSIYAADYKRHAILSEIAPNFTEDYIKKQNQYIKNMF